MALLTLEEWARQTYETPPTLNTLRRWAREGLIQPPPEKHGRSYYVYPAARYIEPGVSLRSDRYLSLVERIAVDRALAKQPSESHAKAGK
ncbi:excisionase [Stutzerimonas marianensis]